jgi:ABC-2 type transport system ATP-binding protein
MLYAAIYGVERERIRANLDDILSWAGLEEFRQTLFKHLSAGMKVRLAFSTYRYFEGDIFLMDEALAAGDQNFQKKCQQVLMDQSNTGRTMVIASHNAKFIEKFCNKTVWIEGGQLQAYGKSEEVVQRYRASAGPAE